MSRRMYTWFHTMHERMHEVDVGPEWLQEHIQRAKMIITYVSVPGLSFAELRKSHDFQCKPFINIKDNN